MEPYKSPTATPLHLFLWCIPLLLPTYPLYGAAQGNQKTEEIESVLKPHKALEDLAEVPLLLEVIKAILDEKGMEPLSNTTPLHTLYQTLINKLWEGTSVNYTQQERAYTEALLSSLAVYGMEQNQLIIGSEVIEEALATLKKNGNSELPDEPTDRQLLYASGLFNPTSEQTNNHVANTFLHPSVQAYYAAYYLACVNPDALPATLRQHKYTPRYQLVWCFYTGFLNNQPIPIYQFMQQLGDNPRDIIGYAHTMLQARLLSEVRLPDKVMCQLTKRCGLTHSWESWFSYAFTEEKRGRVPLDTPLLNALINSIASLPPSPLKTWFIETTWLPKLTDKGRGEFMRANSTYALGQLGDSVALPALLDALSEGEELLRTIAAMALGKLGDRAAVPALSARRQDENENVRYYANIALAEIAETQHLPPFLSSNKGNNECPSHTKKRGLPTLLNALLHEDNDVRYNAAVALGELGNPKALPNLLHTLEDTEQKVRCAAAMALDNLPLDVKALPTLLNALKRKSKYVRSAVAKVLGKLGDDEALPHLLNALKSKEGSVRSGVAIAFGQLRNSAALPALLETLKDDNKWIRYHVTVALGELGDGAALFPLLDRLKDRVPCVQDAAKAALPKLHLDAKVLPHLLGALQDNDEKVRCGAAIALGQLGEAVALPDLMNALKDQEEDWNVRCAAATALGQLGEAVALPDLMKALKEEEEDWHVRCAVAIALGELGDEDALHTLLYTLEDKNQSVRHAAAMALGKMNHAGGINPLIQMLKNRDSNVRQAAATALEGFNMHEVPALKVALHAKSEAIRLFAQVALQQGFFLYEEVKTPLIKAAKANKPHIRLYVIKILGKLRGTWTVIPLIHAYKDHYVASHTDISIGRTAEATLAKFSWEVKLQEMLPAIAQKEVQDYLTDSCIKQQTPLWVDVAEEEGKANHYLYFIEENSVKHLPITPTQYNILNGLSVK